MSHEVKITLKQMRYQDSTRSIIRLSIPGGTPLELQGNYVVPRMDDANEVGWLTGEQQMVRLREWVKKGYKV
jgi:hypothetical protein